MPSTKKSTKKKAAKKKPTKKSSTKKASSSKKSPEPKEVNKSSKSKSKPEENESSKIKKKTTSKKEKKPTAKKGKTSSTGKIRPPVEELHAIELLALSQNDSYPRPMNWYLSPKMVKEFIIGSNTEYEYTINGKKGKTKISPKFIGDRDLIEKAIVTLASERALMLIGEPGTAKSWLSEHLTAAICGKSTYLIQGTAGTTEDQIRYTWNYALLVSEGPSEKSLVPSPTINAMTGGKILRFEELTRCPQEIQDSLISILSEKVVPVPELGEEHLIYGIPGFNVIATANDRDRGVNEMSAALKRRFNFIYIPVLTNKEQEKKIVLQRATSLLEKGGIDVQISNDVLDLLVTVFQELREGKASDGGRFTPISSVMSTSEEISLLHDSAIYANFFGKNQVSPEIIAMNLADAIVKDDTENLEKLREYFNVVVKRRSSKKDIWRKFGSAVRWKR